MVKILQIKWIFSITALANIAYSTQKRSALVAARLAASLLKKILEK